MTHAFENTSSCLDTGRPKAQDSWAKLLTSSMLTRMEVESDAQDFNAKLTGASFGAGNIFLASAPRQVIRHTISAGAESLDAAIFIIQMRNGTFLVDACGEKIGVENGQCVLVNNAQPFVLSSERETIGLVVRFPTDWLCQWVTGAEYLPSQLITNDGWGAALSAFVQNVNPTNIDTLTVSPGAVAEQLAVMLELATAIRLPEVRTSTKQRQRLEAVRQAIRDMSHEPEVTPLEVANQLGMSKRYLHQILATSGSSFSQEVSDVRLSRARVLLTSHSTSLTVTEVAMRCGFSDSSHFAKRFKAKYGLTPKQTKVDVKN
jgi:AraC-like DNA-binding protein